MNIFGTGGTYLEQMEPIWNIVGMDGTYLEHACNGWNIFGTCLEQMGHIWNIVGTQMANVVKLYQYVVAFTLCDIEHVVSLKIV